MAEAKHSFVDDYPYLVYSPDVETTYDGNSGGMIVVTADTDGYPSMSAEEIAESANAGNLIVFKRVPDGVNNVATYYQLSYINTGETKSAIFSSFDVTEGEGEQTFIEASSIVITTKEAPITIYALED